MAKKRKKALLKGFPAGAWSGACFGLTSTILIGGLSTTVFPKPLIFVLMSAGLSAVLLIGGVAGYTLFKQFSRSSRR